MNFVKATLLSCMRLTSGGGAGLSPHWIFVHQGKKEIKSYFQYSIAKVIVCHMKNGVTTLTGAIMKGGDLRSNTREWRC